MHSRAAQSTPFVSSRLRAARGVLGEQVYEAAGAIVIRPDAPPLMGPGLLHEWLSETAFPPLLLAACLAHRSVMSSERGRWRAVFVGPQVFPYVRAFSRWPGLTEMMTRATFVHADRSHLAFVLDAVLRCEAVSFLIADGSGIDMTLSRRLQLAASAGGALALVLRPTSELGELSAAATRWRVRSFPSDDDQPRWSIELLRCKGLRPTTDARRWTVRVCHETGDVRLAPDAPDRPGSANGRAPPGFLWGFANAGHAGFSADRPHAG